MLFIPVESNSLNLLEALLAPVSWIWSQSWFLECDSTTISQSASGQITGLITGKHLVLSDTSEDGVRGLACFFSNTT